MTIYENECCDCAVPAYPCMGNSCSLRNVPHHLCDKCGEEEKLYHYDGQELCVECIISQLELVEGSDIF